MYLICKNKDQQGETQNIINDVIRSIFIFIIMFALYFILDKYVLSILDLDKTSYLTNQFLWGTESINVILKSTFKNLIKVYSGYYNCYHPFFTILNFDNWFRSSRSITIFYSCYFIILYDLFFRKNGLSNN